MVLVGLGAAGRAGNASAAGRAAVVFLFNAVDDAFRDGIGDPRVLAEADDDEAHGVCPGFAPMRFDDTGGRAGNGLLDDGDDQLAFWFAVDRDDCAVELFNFNTRDPPCAAGPPPKASPVADPGSDG